MIDARRATTAVFLVHATVSGSLVSRLPWIQERLHLNPAQFSASLLLPTALGGISALLVAGRFVGRYGSRTMARLSLGSWCVLLPVAAVAPRQLWLAAAALGCGAAGGVADIAMNTQAVTLERRRGRSLTPGFHGAWSLGALAGSGLGALAAHLGVDARPHLAAVGLLALAVTLGATRELAGPAREDVPERPGFAVPPLPILKIGAVGFAAMYVEVVVEDWSGIYLRRVADAGAGLAAASYTLFILAMAVTRLRGDGIAARIGPARTVALSAAVGVLGGLVVTFARSPAWVLGGFVLVAFGVARVQPLAVSAAGHLGGSASRAIAGLSTLTYTAAFLGPIIFGLIADATSLPAAFGVVTALLAAVGLFSGQLRAPAFADEPGAR